MIFPDSGLDFWRQNPSKINCKMTSKIAYLNLTHFGVKIRHKIPPRHSQDAHWTPQEDPRRSKTSPKTAPGRLQNDPKTLPGRFKILSRRPQDGSKAPKTPQNASKTPQDAPRRLRDASKTPSDLHFGRFVIDVWSIFD